MQISRGTRTGLLAGFGVGTTLMLLLDPRRAARRENRRVTMAPTNHMLAARVAAELDHHVQHGRGIQVFADRNRITLRGVALRNELRDVLTAVQRVSGVELVRNQLEVRDTPGNVLALQS